MITVFIYWLVGLILTVCISIFTIKKNREIGYTLLTTLLAGYILISNILTPRLVSFDLGFIELMIVTGSIIWPFTAQLSDMINEIYGKKRTIISAILGYTINLLFVVFILMADATKPVWDISMEEFWESYFLPSGRVLFTTIDFRQK